MTNVAYNTNIPFASNNPSQDQPRMQENTNSLKSLIEIDHIGFGNNQGGYHLPIHQPPQGSWNQVTRVATPPLVAIAGVNQLLSLDVTDDNGSGLTGSQLFNFNSNGGAAQLSGSYANTEGWVWSGGLLFQWGVVTTPSSGTFAGGTANGKVTFKTRSPGNTIPFPSSCFMVQATPTYLNGFTPQSFFPAAISIATPLLNTEFDWTYNSTKAGVLYTGFFWIAVGI